VTQCASGTSTILGPSSSWTGPKTVDGLAPGFERVHKEAVARIRGKLERQLADLETTMDLALSTAY
jgi:hypothetical protein